MKGRMVARRNRTRLLLTAAVTAPATTAMILNRGSLAAFASANSEFLIALAGAGITATAAVALLSMT